MKTLYIIGNGFDMYHGLNTSYKSFGFYLKTKNSQIYDYLIEYYGLPNIEDINENYYEWNEFEKALAHLDYERVLEDNADFLPNVASDDFRDSDWHALQQVMSGVVDELTINLFNEFKNFIQGIEFPDKLKVLLLNLDLNSFFLSFNYTATLERYYNIHPKKILYLHNKAFSDKTLILGHGIDPTSFEKTQEIMPAELTLEQQDEWRERMEDQYDFSYESGREAILGYFHQSFKYTEDIISSNELFFSEINDVENIYVLGQSVSEVDQPYFKKIIESIENKDIIWTVSYRTNKQPIYNNLISLGLHHKQIILLKLEELTIKNDSNYKLF